MKGRDEHKKGDEWTEFQSKRKRGESAERSNSEESVDGRSNVATPLCGEEFGDDMESVVRHCHSMMLIDFSRRDLCNHP